MTTFTCTLVSNKIHLVQDSGGASYNGNAKVEIYNFSGVSIVSTVSITSGVSLSDFNFPTLLNLQPNGNYVVRALDSATFNVSIKLHPTLTLTKLGTNSYTGTPYVPPFTWLSHVATPLIVATGANATSTVHISEGAHTFAIEIDNGVDNSILYVGNVTTDSSGIGTVSYPVSGTIGDTISPFVFQPDTSDAGLQSNDITIGVISMAGTGQGRLFSARVRLQEPNGRKYPLVGNGLDAAGAIGELQAKLALVDARVTVISGVRLSGALTSGQITAFDAVNAARVTDTGGYNNVDITLREVFNAGTATQVIETPTLRIENAVDGIASSSIDGTVDVTNTLVAALATAYVDEDGNTGYAAYHGRFVR